MSTIRFQRIAASQMPVRAGAAVDDETLSAAAKIVNDVRDTGKPALRRYAAQFNEAALDMPLVIEREQLEATAAALPTDTRELLERTAARIRTFAESQRETLHTLRTTVPGGEAGHTVTPVARAGCYAPAGRYPLPSSVLMTVIPARVAGVNEVIVSSPAPNEITMAAAAIAGANRLLAVGGAHAIAAMAYGVVVAPCDVIVGPGNRWVTAAKQLVAGRVGIDMLAGPSELLVVADDTADPDLIAADLLAQAEHDVDARVVLIVLHEPLIAEVQEAIENQLADLPTADTARASLAHAVCAAAQSPAEAQDLCNRFAPEHLALHVRDAEAWLPTLTEVGTVFVGASSAEAFGDYGAGPNHVLPTGGAARISGGLSVLTFLRVRTWLNLTAAPDLIGDVAAFARLERLEAHARSAEMRAKKQH